MSIKKSTVFLGAASNMTEMEQSFVVDEMEEGDIGLYGHTNGVFPLVADGQMATFMSSFDKTEMAPGVYEWGFSSGYSEGSVTIKNNGLTTQTINIGETFKGSNGDTYIVESYAGQPGYETGDTGANKNGYVSTSSGGYYTMTSGQSITLELEDETIGTGGNLDANNITSFNGKASDISITSSTSFTGGQSLSSVISYSFNGTIASSPAYYLERKYGYSASETNVNLNEDLIYSQNDINSWKTYVDSARENAGVMSVAPILSFNGLDVDYSQDFATSAYWAPYREMALYGGGISFDTPPDFMMYFTQRWFPIFGQSVNTYINFIESEVKWANSEGIRSSMIISPQSGDNSDAGGLLNATKTMIARLEKDNALPSQFIVENYGNTSNFFSTDSNSLNNVATWLNQNVTTNSTNSESNLENIGQSSATMIMVGIKPNVSISYGQSTLLYDASALYSTNSTEEITATLNLNEKGLSLVSNYGTLSNNNETLIYTGTQSEITTMLSKLKVDDEVSGSTANGNANLSLNFKDASSEIDGTTAIQYAINTSTNMTISEGNSENINISTLNSSILGQNGGLTMTGNTSLTLTGVFSSLNIENTGNNVMYAGLTGNGVINGGNGTPGITLENTSASLKVSDTNISVYGYGGTLTKTGSGNTISYGSLSHMYIYSGENNQISTALNGDGYIGNSIGTMGVTLTGNSSNLTVDSSYAYITAGDGSVTFNNGASGNITGAKTNAGGLFVNANGGQVNYQADNETNATFVVKNGELNATYDKGYTSSVIDMNDKVDANIKGFTVENGNIIATNLKSMDDLSISYQNGGALITEAGNNAKIFIDDVSKGMISLYSKIGNEDFSKNYGSNTLLIATDQHTLYLSNN